MPCSAAENPLLTFFKFEVSKLFLTEGNITASPSISSSDIISKTPTRAMPRSLPELRPTFFVAEYLLAACVLESPDEIDKLEAALLLIFPLRSNIAHSHRLSFPALGAW